MPALRLSRPSIALRLPTPGGSLLPGTPTLPPRMRRMAARERALDPAREERITRYCFYGFMLSNVLGLAAAGYAILTL